MAQPLRKPDYQATPPPEGIYEESEVVRLSDARSPSYQAYRILQFAFVVIPIVAGIDKYFQFLTNWDRYVLPSIPNMFGVSPHTFMLGAGVIEVVAGLGVALFPKVFSYVVAAWLFLIICNLVLMGGNYDIAARDLGLCLGAIALGRLSQQYYGKRVVRV